MNWADGAISDSVYCPISQVQCLIKKDCYSKTVQNLDVIRAVDLV